MKKGFLISVFALSIVLFAGAFAFAGDKPSLDLDWYGYFKLDGAFDQNLTSHGNYVMWVEQPAYNKNDDQFNMTANQTSFGFKATGKGYQDTQVKGQLEFDLYGASVAENKAMLMLRHAYFSIQKGQFKLLAGQTYDLVSPLNPSTLNYSVLWGCGNIGYRRPQVSLWYTFNPNQKTDINVAGGFFRTIGSDLTPTFTLSLGETTDGPDDGTDAGIPSFQGYFDVKHSWASKGFFRAGVSGLWGQLKSETNFGNSEKYESWAVVGHWMVSWPQGYGFSGEYFTGSNIGDYLGGILQGSTIEGVSSQGGWISAWAEISPAVKFGIGYGFDDPKDEDIASGRSKNSCFYGNVNYTIVTNVSIGLEVSQWETDYLAAESAKCFRTQTSFLLKF